MSLQTFVINDKCLNLSNLNLDRCSISLRIRHENACVLIVRLIFHSIQSCVGLIKTVVSYIELCEHQLLHVILFRTEIMLLYVKKL